MDESARLILPFAILLARTSAFLAAGPLFSWSAIPMQVRAGLALLLTVFFAMTTPVALPAGAASALGAGVLLAGEVLCGLALGMAAHLVFLGAQQGGRIAAMQMGLAEAGIYDPVSGEEEQPMGLFFEIAFALLFLAAGGHRLLVMVLARSYESFPAGAPPGVGAMTEGVVRAGATMLLFGLKLSAPVLAAFLLMSVVLAVLSRVLPEMNVLLTSFPLRVGLGLLLAAAIMPALNGFAVELAEWMDRFLIR